MERNTELRFKAGVYEPIGKGLFDSSFEYFRAKRVPSLEKGLQVDLMEELSLLLAFKDSSVRKEV